MVEAIEDPGEQRRDAIRYRRVLVGSLAVTMMAFAVDGLILAALLKVPADGASYSARVTAHQTGVVALLVGVWFAPVQRLSWPLKVATLGGLCGVGVAVRAGLQVALGVHAADQIGVLLVDAAVAAVSMVFSVAIGLAFAEYQQALVRGTRATARQSQLAASALEALRAEEARVRREVADGLHGTVQQQLVLIDAELRNASAGLVSGAIRPADAAGRIDRVRASLDQLRERDIRDMSRLLYPSGLHLGLAQAGRIFIRQIPPSIEVTARIDESVIAADDPASGGIAIDRRLLALRVLEEAVSNAIRHGRAEHLDISLCVDERVLHLVIDDDGRALVHASGDGERAESGLRLLRESLSRFGGGLDLAAGPRGGRRLTARLPLTTPDATRAIAAYSGP